MEKQRSSKCALGVIQKLRSAWGADEVFVMLYVFPEGNSWQRIFNGPSAPPFLTPSNSTLTTKFKNFPKKKISPQLTVHFTVFPGCTTLLLFCSKMKQKIIVCLKTFAVFNLFFLGVKLVIFMVQCFFH